MANKKLEDPSVAWVSARLAEMDAAIDQIKQQMSDLAPDAKSAAERNIETMQTARDTVEEVARKALDQNQRSLAGLRDEMQPAWSTFENALESWSTLSKTQHEMFAAQMRAHADAWDQAFNQFRSAAETAQTEQRRMLLDQIERASTTVSQTQASAAAMQRAAWDDLSKALKESRSQAEKASEQILSALRQK